jgi:hypothetical protein
MKQIIYASIFIGILIIPTFAWSQDSINLLNGELIIAKSIYNEPNSSLLKYDIIKRKVKIKQKSVDKADVFSINFAKNEQQILYSQDSALGFERSISQMEAYIYGEREAITNYKTPWVTIGGVAVGFVPTTFYFNFYGLLAPVVYGVIMGITTPKIKIKASENLKAGLLYDKNFIDGYKTIAIKKKIKNAILGAVLGVVVAGITTTIINIE